VKSRCERAIWCQELACDAPWLKLLGLGGWQGCENLPCPNFIPFTWYSNCTVQSKDVLDGQDKHGHNYIGEL
jgi:hypothetical protein